LHILFIYSFVKLLGEEPYSFPSDVYSFAVTLWEVWTQSLAYKGIQSEAELLKFLHTKRLEVPSNCLYGGLIDTCWAQLPNERPDFNYIVEKLREIKVPM
jgi:hypothetical protein